MVRIIDGILQDPILIFGSWFLALILLLLLFRYNPEFNNEELAEYASLGAIIFLVQSVLLPLKFFPVVFTLSGVPFVILIKGVNKGLIISSSAIVLNHIFIPGAISMLGINLANMLISGLVAGLVPSLFYNKLGRRIRYLTGFLSGILYFLTVSILIYIEFYFSTFNLPFSDYFVLLLVPILILGIIEGFLTAIASSYYYRNKESIQEEEIEELENEEKDDELEKIRFLDE